MERKRGLNLFSVEIINYTTLLGFMTEKKFYIVEKDCEVLKSQGSRMILKQNTIICKRNHKIYVKK